ncbi:helix-turn-helix domain-containing protein [Halalkalicoccus jeotgali]|uniref:DNA binding protein n=1 Tax=Halalkalicoccus jeotgali (strain DSM 18796 / CECT 7217 / JCM 14584 / KCTC 4019 / B3) TaxID=795797 RepID=D8J7C5_HALJB|nr:helix-turn-helix domain-containing protein [Halalkalicoccus jeotgali]ADJ14020.1 DNA binding protein [Halalkalicoccus jeotgali B3]ELY33934.1 DNA binding protein [Halalkalicoccus jeotgali B3]
MFTATVHFTQHRNCILRRLTAGVDAPIPIEIEEIQNGVVTFVLRSGEHTDGFQSELEAAEHVEHVTRLDEENLLVTKPSCGAYSAIYRNHGTLRRSNTVSGRQREYTVLVFRREDLRNIIEDLGTFGTVTLGKLEEFTPGVEPPLTERQHEVAAQALARGYYDWPRGITNEKLAEKLGISRATLHEHLRKAERTVLSSALAESHRQVGEGRFERIDV